MNKILAWCVVAFFMTILIVSSSGKIMKQLVKYRTSTDNFVIRSCREYYGILYGFSFLPDFKLKLTEESQIEVVKKNLPRKFSLYAICDSYFWQFVKSDSVFNGVEHLDYSRWNDWNQLDLIVLDTAKRNILLIEIDERKIRNLGNKDFVFNKLKTKRGSRYSKNSTITGKGTLLDEVFNKNIENNLEFNLFDYNWLLPFKETKASINYNFFDRIDKDVVMSMDKKFLFSKPTVDTLERMSSFNQVSKEEVTNLVRSINEVYLRYKKSGFDEVYFSFIPNSVTINDPARGVHNNLIERIEDDTTLQAPCISIIDDFKNSKKQLYYKSDTHWNYNGFNIWLNRVNFCFDTLYYQKK